VADAVDGVLRGRVLPVEIRTRMPSGEVEIDRVYPEMRNVITENEQGRGSSRSRSGNGRSNNVHAVRSPQPTSREYVPKTVAGEVPQTLKVYAYGVARNRLEQAARRLHVPLEVASDLGNADAVVTLKNYYRRRPKLIVDAERRGMSIYVLRANTVTQMENFLIDVFNLEVNPLDPFGEALREAETAIMQIRAGASEVDLSPQNNSIRRRQHQLARKAQLESQSFGQEPNRRVRISRGKV
jgi:hypothetical protein